MTNIQLMMKRIPGLASVSRVGRVYRAARVVARREQDDDVAVVALAARVRNDRRGIRGALKRLERDRREFVDDRAYRLLQAVATGRPIESIRAELVEIFRREEQLGRTPLRNAFAALAELEPRLKDVEVGDRETEDKRLAELLGPNALSEDELVRSQLALSIASHFLYVGADDPSTTSSYFEAPVVRVTRTGSVRWNA